AHAGRVVAADTLAEALFADRPPANPAAALHSQVSRLRQVLGPALHSEPLGYGVQVEPQRFDAARFERLRAQARVEPQRAAELLGEALDLWRGEAYAEFGEIESVRLEAIRLDELRLTTTEELAEALTADGRSAEAVTLLEPFVAAHPLRERARAALMRALYAQGRHPDALRHYTDYREHLADELGLEPSVALQRLETDILRHGLQAPATAPEPVPSVSSTPAVSSVSSVRAGPAPLDRLQARYLRRHDGHPIAAATVGAGPPLVAVPAWVTSLDLVASGRDPRASLLERLARRTTLTLYDRLGTGLSRGPQVPDHGLEDAAAELEAVLEHVVDRAGPAAVLGMSQAGPVAVAVAARRPDLVRRLVLFGTYADGPATFPSAELRAAAVGLVRTHARLGTNLLAELYRPGAGPDAARHFAAVLRDSADPHTAAAYLEAVYATDVSGRLGAVTAPALVLHYRGDRVIPFQGARQLAGGLRDARFQPLDGDYHLPDARDLDVITDAIVDFVS
ncbi:MAG TPA: alpha/beta fold hydrolase, partial [Pseudonocardia sp.]|nr:alpha/beta fold hydrolase [Pseudonocardia sp.]